MMPTLTPREQTELEAFWRLYEEHGAQLDAKVEEGTAQLPELAELLRDIPKEQREESDRRSKVLQRAAILENEWAPYLTELRTQGATYAKLGLSFGAWYELIRLFRTTLLDLAEQKHDAASGDASRSLLSAIKGLDLFVDIAMASIGEAYLATKEEIIASQQDAIRELSTPVLQVRERMLIMPIVGMVDTHRARQLTEDLLRAIRARRARIVVMDITGVPIVDSKVANHFIQTVDAARLMGAKVIITGVSPEIAQTLVTIGANLGEVRTIGDLEGGIEEAEKLLGLKVVSLDEEGRRAPRG